MGLAAAGEGTRQLPWDLVEQTWGEARGKVRVEVGREGGEGAAEIRGPGGGEEGGGKTNFLRARPPTTSQPSPMHRR